MNRQLQWALAPADDLTHSAGPGGQHQTAVVGEATHPGRQHLLRLATRCDIAAPFAHHTIATMCSAAAGLDSLPCSRPCWRQRAGYCSSSSSSSCKASSGRPWLRSACTARSAWVLWSAALSAAVGCLGGQRPAPLCWRCAARWAGWWQFWGAKDAANPDLRPSNETKRERPRTSAHQAA